MRKKTTRVISILLVAAMLTTLAVSAAGCGREEEPEEDTTTTISVTADELAPEITDEDLGITRKDKEELSKVVGYQSWEGYNFLVLKNEGGEGNTETTVQIEDEELFNALYNARLYTYVDVSYESVSPDDQMYASYAKGLRSLGSSFYSLLGQGRDMEEAAAGEGPVKEEIEGAGEPLEAEGAENLEEAEGEGKTGDPGETEAAAEEAESPEEAGEISPPAPEAGEYNADVEISVAAEEAKSIEAALQEAIEEYMQEVSLNRATQVLVFALDGELLGEMTATKLNDYVNAFPIEPVPYGPDGEAAYVSDLADGVYYRLNGFLASEAGNYLYKIKNDTGLPITIYLYSENGSKEEYIFGNYMGTDNSTGWYLVEDEYSFSSTEPSYTVKIEHKNSDTDLANSLPDGLVLYIDELSSEVEEVGSKYQAIVNNTDQEVYIKADTGDYCILGSKQSIGVHKSAYSTLQYYFEGAGLHPADGTEDLPAPGEE